MWTQPQCQRCVLAPSSSFFFWAERTACTICGRSGWNNFFPCVHIDMNPFILFRKTSDLLSLCNYSAVFVKTTNWHLPRLFRVKTFSIMAPQCPTWEQKEKLSEKSLAASCFVLLDSRLQIPMASRWVSWKYFPLVFPLSRRHVNKAPSVAAT